MSDNPVAKQQKEKNDFVATELTDKDLQQGAGGVLSEKELSKVSGGLEIDGIDGESQKEGHTK